MTTAIIEPEPEPEPEVVTEPEAVTTAAEEIEAIAQAEEDAEAPDTQPDTQPEAQSAPIDEEPDVRYLVWGQVECVKRIKGGGKKGDIISGQYRYENIGPPIILYDTPDEAEAEKLMDELVWTGEQYDKTWEDDNDIPTYIP